jgi:hypothetical protein
LGELRNGDRPDGKQIARHLAAVFAALPSCVGRLFARADCGFYCWEAVQAYEHAQACILVARKTSRLLDRLQPAAWKPSPQTDADQEFGFCYQPEGWSKAYRFIALRYKNDKPLPKREQYQLLDTPQYLYRVFVTNMEGEIASLVWFYNQRAAAENLIKEANNDAGLAAHRSPLQCYVAGHSMRALRSLIVFFWRSRRGYFSLSLLSSNPLPGTLIPAIRNGLSIASISRANHSEAHTRYAPPVKGMRRVNEGKRSRPKAGEVGPSRHPQHPADGGVGRPASMVYQPNLST